MARRVFDGLLLLFLALDGIVAQEALPPDRVPGLVAWYTVDSLHTKLRDGDKVRTWPDSSGNGHDLTDDANGLPAIFRTLQLNGKPVVEVFKQNSYSVAAPFELGDHTIFLVYATRAPTRALLRSDLDERAGLILNKEGAEHQIQQGKTDRRAAYNLPGSLPTGFSVTVLAREAGVLRAFIDGVDRSSESGIDEPIRVGKFFKLEHTKVVGSDGLGLLVGEMAFYDRYLTETERDAITRHLAERYTIALEIEPPEPAFPPVPEQSAVQAWLSGAEGPDLNQTAVTLEWKQPVKVEPPFQHSPDKEPSRLYCTRKNARVRLFVKLPMVTAEPTASVRVLILKNGQAYQSVEGMAQKFEGAPGALTATAQFSATLTLDAGDWVEIVTASAGAAGAVTLVPGQAIWTAVVTR